MKAIKVCSMSRGSFFGFKVNNIFLIFINLGQFYWTALTLPFFLKGSSVL